MITRWPADHYNVDNIIQAIQGELGHDRQEPLLLESLAELSGHFTSLSCVFWYHRHIVKRQPAKALPYLIKLRRPDVFDIIRDHNLFATVQDQVLQLVDLDSVDTDFKSQIARVEPLHPAESIQLLVDHTLSIPVSAVWSPGITTDSNSRLTLSFAN
jgi:hypothetical protein